MPLKRFALAALGGIAVTTGCSKPAYDPALPPTSELGSPGGLRLARVITHFHTPYSWDACDKKGLVDGRPDPSCLSHVREAACKNRIDFLFLSDHPANMADYELTDLLLHDASKGDTLTSTGAGPYTNRLGACQPSDAAPVVLAGFESRVVALGMTRHLASDSASRRDLYDNEDAATNTALQTTASALVVIPHTESRSVALIQSLAPDAIEIYNVHANLDPKIRKADLGESAFAVMPDLVSYLVDPWSTLTPDFVFLSFLKLHSVYFQRWSELITGGMRVAGVAGSDSHENVFNNTVADGERLDSHRRLMRMVSNHVLTASLDADAVKTAIRNGRSWIVFEGLGSPVGMEFTAEIGAGTVGVGGSGSLSGGTATIRVALPALHSTNRGSGDAPKLRLRLLKMLAGGGETEVATSTGTALSYAGAGVGSYRAEILMTPYHLRELLGAYWVQAFSEYPWIVTNPIHLDP